MAFVSRLTVWLHKDLRIFALGPLVFQMCISYASVIGRVCLCVTGVSSKGFQRQFLKKDLENQIKCAYRDVFLIDRRRHLQSEGVSGAKLKVCQNPYPGEGPLSQFPVGGPPL